MSELKCTRYREWEWGDGPDGRIPPCHCPTCGGFLKWDKHDWGQVYCNKCKTELLVIPERDEETNEELTWGKICPISKKEA